MRTIQQLIKKHELSIEQSLRERLFKDGTYADGRKIRTVNATGAEPYSPFTVELKREKGQPVDRVTLEDTGELYESFNTIAEPNSFVIEFEDEKEDGSVSDNIDDLDEAIKLGPKEIEELQEKIIIDLQHDFRQEAIEAILYRS